MSDIDRSLKQVETDRQDRTGLHILNAVGRPGVAAHRERGSVYIVRPRSIRLRFTLGEGGSVCSRHTMGAQRSVQRTRPKRASHAENIAGATNGPAEPCTWMDGCTEAGVGNRGKGRSGGIRGHDAYEKRRQKLPAGGEKCTSRTSGAFARSRPLYCAAKPNEDVCEA